VILEFLSAADNLSTLEAKGDAAGLFVNPGKLDATNDEVALGATAAQAGGLAVYPKFVSTADTNTDIIKASAGRLYSIYAIEGTATNSFIKLYDKSSAPAPATDSALLKGVFAAIQTGGKCEMVFPNGIPFANGIAIAITRNAALTDNTAVAAADCIFHVTYK